MAEQTPIKIDPDSVSENTEPQTQEALGIKGEQTQQNPKGLESTEGVNAFGPEPLKTDSFLNALIENNQNKAPAPDTNQSEVDVEALQQLIAEGADPTQLLEETAAGEGEPTDGGGIYIPIIDRTAEEVLADTGFDTTTTESQDIVVEEVLITESVVIDPPDNGVEIFDLTPVVDGGEATFQEANLSDGTSPDTSALTQVRNFTISAPDGLGTLTFGGVVVIDASGVTGNIVTTGLFNQILVTGYNEITGVVTYEYSLLDNEAHTQPDNDNSLFDSVAVVLIDSDGDTDSDTLSVQILDDTPLAVDDDTESVTEDGSTSTFNGNVLGNDVVGADATVDNTATFKEWSAGNATEVTALGTFGTLTLGNDGAYEFTLDNSLATVQALTSSDTNTYTLDYTMEDADGDESSATLTIEIKGADDTQTVTVKASGGAETTVDETGLVDGRGELDDAALKSDQSEVVSGTFSVAATDGVKSFSVGGVIFDIATATYPSSAIDTGEGSLVITGYTGGATAGTVSYTYTLKDAITSANAATTFELDTGTAITVTGQSGSTSAASDFVIQINDDTPLAVDDDTESVTEDGSTSTFNGNVLGNDVVGADATVDNTATFKEWSAGNATEVTALGTFGTLTLGNDGAYEFTLDNSLATVQALTSSDTNTYTLDYTMEDADGDESSATLTIEIKGADDTQTVTVKASGGAETTVDETGLVDGRGELDDAALKSDQSEVVSGTFSVAATDGVKSFSVGGVIFDIATATYPSSAIDTGEGSLVITGYTGGATAGTVSYTYTLKDAITSANAATTFELDTGTAITVTGQSGSTSAASDFVIQINDDTPLATIEANSVKATVDETATSSVAAVINTGTYIKGDDPDVSGAGYIGQAVTAGAVVTLSTETYGADGAATSGAKVYALTVTTASSGLTLTDGSAINLANVAGTIVGVVQGSGTFAGKAAFAITINTTSGVVTVEQYLSLDHPTEATATNSFDSYNEAVNLATGSLGVTVTLKDGDNDTVTSTAADISGQVSFKDDGPSAFYTTSSHLVDEKNNTHSVTNSLGFSDKSGADGVGTVEFNITVGEVAKDANGLALKLNGENLTLHYGGTNSSPDKTILIAKTSGGSPKVGYEITLDAANYTFTGNGMISNGTELSSIDLSAAKGSNTQFLALKDMGGVTDTTDLLVTAVDSSGVSTVNSTNNTIGVNQGASIDSDEKIRFDFLEGMSVDNQGHYISYTTHTSISQYRQNVHITAKNKTANIKLWAVVADNDQDFIGDSAGESFVNLSTSDISVWNGAINKTGDVTITASSTDESVTITGIENGWSFQINSSEFFSAVQVDGAAGTYVFSLGAISMVTQNISDPIDLSHNIVGIDGDGDQVSSTLDATLYPSAKSIEGTTSDDSTLNGTAGIDYIFGYVGDDTLTGLGSDDILVGGADNDTLDGGNDDDILLGGFGNDALTGGSGNDTFKWQAGETGTDTITDWTDGTNKIDLSELLQNETDITLVNYLEFSYAASDTTLTIDVDGSGNNGDQVIVFEGVDLTSLGGNQATITSLLGTTQLITD